MFQSYSEIDGADSDSEQPRQKHRWLLAIALPAWVFFGFFVSELVVSGLVWLLVMLDFPVRLVNQSVLSTVLAAVVYLMTLGIVVLVPVLARKRLISATDIGINRWPSWGDIFITPAGFVVYLIISSVLILLATHVLPWFNPNQPQNTGFEHLALNYEYILAFITLVVVAPFAEEVLFRGYLFGKLRQYVPIWAAILVTSLLFGAVHGAWDVAIDTFALSIVLCYLRETTGSIWASVLLHMAKNGLAFYLLFIYPSLLSTLVR